MTRVLSFLSPSLVAIAAAVHVFPLLAAGLPEARLKQVFTGLDTPLPVSVVIPGDGSRREFLILQGGKILILPKDRSSAVADVFLDVSNRDLIEKAFEEGLLGLAFHPEFRDNRRFFIYYTMQDPKQSVISEMKVSKDDPDAADPETERVLFEVFQPFWNHNSGNMLFGPDGYLYICFGDGGKRDDPLNLAQNLFVLNGKMLRIDVDTKSGHREYGIPADNPFVGMEGTRPEIWAYGLRNPWGIAFDPQTGELWCADVGQDLWEEVNLIRKGGNYGWSFREGARKFALKDLEPPADAELIDPVIEYSHADGLSITGGFVYDGDKLPHLKGYYLYGDFITGKLWACKLDPSTGAIAENHLIFARPEGADVKEFKFTGICPDANGEVLLLTHAGKIFEME